MNISVAIPFHGKRYSWTVRTLFNVHGHNNIKNIVINVEPGESDIKRLLPVAARMKKVSIVFNKKKLGPLENKVETVARCPDAWVALIDSDNIVNSSYFLHSKRDENPSIIKCPAVAMPYFDYRNYIGEDINLKMAIQISEEKRGMCLLNTGNYLFNKAKWLESLKDRGDFNPIASDVLWANFLCMKNGMVLRVVPSMTYIHNIHGESTYYKTRTESHATGRKIIAMMKEYHENRTSTTSFQAGTKLEIPGASNFSAVGGQGRKVLLDGKCADESALLTD